MIRFTEYLTEQKDMGYSRTPKSGYDVMVTVSYLDPITASRTLKKIYFKSRDAANAFKAKPTGFPKGATVEAIKDL
jgi:hypothetical protein